MALDRRGGVDTNEGVVARASSSIQQSPIYQKGMEAVLAASIAGTTFLVLVLPLIIEMDRDQQMTELEMQQASLLGTPSSMMPQPK